ncbi:MAG: hypothetical protein ABJL54_14365 [Halioglobus sp.]
MLSTASLRVTRLSQQGASVDGGSFGGHDKNQTVKLKFCAPLL